MKIKVVSRTAYLLAILLCLALAACASPAAPAAPNEPSPLPTLAASATLTATPTTPTPTGPTLTPSPTPETVYLNSFAVDFSADGRTLAFNSSLDGLVPQDHNGLMDAFVYDTTQDTIELASVFDLGEPLMPVAPQAIGLSLDGRSLLFGAMSNSLYPLAEHYNYAFLRDLQEGTTGRIDFSPVAGWLESQIVPHALSPDGRYLALTVTSMQSNVYLFEVASGQARLVSAGLDDREADGSSFSPLFSPDGAFLAFFSSASNLVGGDVRCSDANPACGDVFLYEIETGALERIPAGLIMRAGYSHSLTLSNRAYQVAWTGYGEEGEFPPVVRLFDRLYDTTEVICAGEPCSGHSPALSADGRWLAFATLGEYAEGGNQPPYAQVYLRDRQSEATSLVSADAKGEPGNDNSGIIYLQQGGWNSDLTISADGNWVAFASQAGSLLPAGVEKRACYAPFLGIGGDDYPCYDLFVYDRRNAQLNWVSGRVD